MLQIRNYKLKFSGWWTQTQTYQLDGEATWINPKAICSIVEELDCKLIDNKFQYATLYRLSFCNQEVYVDAEDFQDILLASDPPDPMDDYFSSKRRR